MQGQKNQPYSTDDDMSKSNVPMSQDDTGKNDTSKGGTSSAHESDTVTKEDDDRGEMEEEDMEGF